MGFLGGKLEESARDSAFGKSTVGVDVMEKLIKTLHLSEWRETADHMRKQIDEMSHEQLEKGKEMFRHVEKEAIDFYEKMAKPAAPTSEQPKDSKDKKL